LKRQWRDLHTIFTCPPQIIQLGWVLSVHLVLKELPMISQPSPIVSSKVKPRLRGWKALLTHHTFRRLTQLAFAIFILVVTIQHVAAGEGSESVTASPEAYCPFGGLETLYKYITNGGSFVSHTHLSNVVILIAVLATALLARSAFCGWICPLGFVQDLVSGFSAFLRKRFPRLRRAMTSLKARGARLAFLERYLRFLKYGVLAWAVIGAAVYGVMVFRDYDPWSALINIAEFSFTPGIVVLGITLVASFFVERPWCRYACPLGAASGLLGKFSPVYLKRESDACKVCKVCTTACPMGLSVHTATTIKSMDCNSCLECVGACPREGALVVKVGFPLMGK
jgi:polyferredoxin